MEKTIIIREHKKIVFLAVISVIFFFLVVYNNVNRLQFMTIGAINNKLNGESLCSNSRRSVKRQKRLPDVIIVGVKKSGTVTLAQFLNYHPSIAAVGEISFFDKGLYTRLSRTASNRDKSSQMRFL